MVAAQGWSDMVTGARGLWIGWDARMMGWGDWGQRVVWWGDCSQGILISKQESQMIKPLSGGKNAISDEEIPTKSVIIRAILI